MSSASTGSPVTPTTAEVKPALVKFTVPSGQGRAVERRVKGQQPFDALGLRGGWMSYFGCRAAPLGPAPAPVVVATFLDGHCDWLRPEAVKGWLPER